MSGHPAKDRIVSREVAKLHRFTTLATIDGYDVIDGNGRPVDHRDSLASANGVAYKLNQAAMAGPDALIAALGGGKRRAAA